MKSNMAADLDLQSAVFEYLKIRLEHVQLGNFVMEMIFTVTCFI